MRKLKRLFFRWFFRSFHIHLAIIVALSAFFDLFYKLRGGKYTPQNWTQSCYRHRYRIILCVNMVAPAWTMGHGCTNFAFILDICWMCVSTSIAWYRERCFEFALFRCAMFLLSTAQQIIIKILVMVVAIVWRLSTMSASIRYAYP